MQSGLSKAHVTEIAIAYEMSRAGDTESWDSLSNVTPPHVMSTFKQTYEAASAANNTHRQALERAGSAAWNAMFFDNKEWVGFYTAQTIQSYMNNFVKPFVSMSASPSPVDTAQVSGKISENLNLTRYVEKPRFTELFSDNDNLRHIAEALEYQRARHLFDDDDHRTKEALARAVHGKNPYLDIDFRAVRAQIQGAFAAHGMAERLENSVAAVTAGPTRRPADR